MKSAEIGNRMEKVETKIPGCFLIKPNVFSDHRGKFVKVMQESAFERFDIYSHFREEFYTTSSMGVLRGMHFQLPPRGQHKIVYCVQGQALDAVLDLRKGSPTYGMFELFELSEFNSYSLYIPKGLAHGFYAQSEKVTLVYKVTEEYFPHGDAGIHWNSAGIPWPNLNPIVSTRDVNLQNFKEFISPFEYSLEPPRDY